MTLPVMLNDREYQSFTELADGAVARRVQNLDSQGAALENVEGTLLASAARTSTATTADQTTRNHRGVIVFLNVTAASGTGGLQVRFMGKDPISGTYRNLTSLPTAIIATGTFGYMIYPGGSAGQLDQGTGVVLPRTWRIQVIHADGSSYTYSLGYCLLV